MNEKTNYTGRRIATFLVVIGLAGAAGFWWRTLTRLAPTPADSRPGAPVGPQLSSATVTLLTSGSKKKLFEQLGAAFQREQPKVTVSVKAMESRDGLQYLLHQASEAERPDLYSPSDPRLATSLDRNWRKAHGGQAILSSSSTDQDFVFGETPVVFLTITAKAAELEPILGGEHPWEKIRERTLQGEAMSWGRLRFSFANPVGSASGLTALGMILSDSALVKRPFQGFLTEISKGAIYDDAAQHGSSQLFEAYISELVSQKTSERDFIVTYESNALQAAKEHPELGLRVIYPTPTPFAMHRICLLESSSRPSERRDAAIAFLNYLKTPAAQKLIQESRLHPRFVPDTLGFEPGFARVTKRAPLVGYNEVMNALQLWNEQIAPRLSP